MCFLRSYICYIHIQYTYLYIYIYIYDYYSHYVHNLIPRYSLVRNAHLFSNYLIARHDVLIEQFDYFWNYHKVCRGALQSRSAMHNIEPTYFSIELLIYNRIKCYFDFCSTTVYHNI